MIIYRFDGSFEGVLSCIFEAFEMKQFQVELIVEELFQPNVFDESALIVTDSHKAQRVLKGLENWVQKDVIRQLEIACLSEKPIAFQSVFQFIIETFISKKDLSKNFGNTTVLELAKIVKSVSRERHRMKAFIRFKKAANELFYAIISPDFNVLPLILTHFKNRYADQQWVIYDEKRKYGFYFDKNQLFPVTFLDINTQQSTALQEHKNDDREALFDHLWKDYFRSTNITERKNTKLHLQHVPKRYWKYLNEKHPNK